MTTLTEHWDISSAGIPRDKDASAYARHVEPNFPRSARICDLGGGTGADGLYFARHGHIATLMDISEASLARARDAAQIEGLADFLATVPANFDDGVLPVANGEFDVVYSHLALHYFLPPTLVRLFAEIYRVVTLGGTAYLALKSPEDMEEMAYLDKTATKISAGVFDDGGFIKTRFPREQLESMLKKAGLASDEYTVAGYIEDFAGRRDRIKSGKTQFLLNDIRIIKRSAQ